MHNSWDILHHFQNGASSYYSTLWCNIAHNGPNANVQHFIWAHKTPHYIISFKYTDAMHCLSSPVHTQTTTTCYNAVPGMAMEMIAITYMFSESTINITLGPQTSIWYGQEMYHPSWMVHFLSISETLDVSITHFSALRKQCKRKITSCAEVMRLCFHQLQEICI